MASNQNQSQSPRTRQRGFASMDPAKQRQIASQGGRAAHEQGVAHEFSPEEAREAGRKGGESVSQNREHMAEIGRKGGESSGGGRGNRSYSQVGNPGGVGASGTGQHRGITTHGETERQDLKHPRHDDEVNNLSE